MAHSEETRRKISAALKGKKKSPEHAAKMATYNLGRKQSLEERVKRAASNRGQKRTEEQRARMSAAHKESWTQDRRNHYSTLYSGKRFGGGDAAGEFYQDGYRMLTGQWDHPLVTSNGSVFEHRIVLYGKIGPGPHHCHWCDKLVEWRSSERATDLCVDHLDGDGLNNDPDNLVPSCFKCNWDRGK